MKLFFRSSGLVILLLFLITGLSIARSRHLIKSGGNFSRILTSNSKGKLGISFGVGKEWRVPRRLTINGEIFLTSTGSLLKDKKIVFPPGAVGTYDIDCSYVFIEMPLLFKYHFYHSGEKILSLYLGPSISMGISDTSYRRKKGNNLSVEDEERENIRYDYTDMDDTLPQLDMFFNSFFGLNSGLALELQHYTFEIRYHYSSIYTASDTKLEENYFTLHFLIGIALD